MSREGHELTHAVLMNGALEEIEGWLRDLRSSDPETRSVAAFALGGARLRRRDVTAALRTALADVDPVVVNFAGQSLGQLGDSASLPTIQGLLAIGSPRDRTGLAWAVAVLAEGRRQRDQTLAIEALSAYLRRARGRTREHAAALLARLETGPSTIR